jgi:hypothetical protein
MTKEKKNLLASKSLMRCESSAFAVADMTPTSMHAWLFAAALHAQQLLSSNLPPSIHAL